MNAIQTTAVFNFGVDSDFNILLREIEFSCFFYIRDSEDFKRLLDHEMFGWYSEAKYHVLIVSQGY